MKIRYEANWELDESAIDEIVENITSHMDKFPDSDFEETVDNCIEQALEDWDTEDYDAFNIDLYYNQLADEVEKRYKEKMMASKQKKKKYFAEIVMHIPIEDDIPLFERIIKQNCNGVHQDSKDIDNAINYIEKRLGMPFLGLHSDVPVTACQISAVYRKDGELVLEA